MGGAKNHGIIMPDCNMEQAVKDIVGAAYGSAGERCMALPVAVTVGKKTGDEFVERMLDAARGLKVGFSTDPEAHYGPVVSAAHNRITSYNVCYTKLLRARIIMTPMNAKLLHKALGEHLQKFEEKFGEIQAPDQGFEHPVERMGFVRD